MPLTLITPPTVAPITFEEIRDILRVNDSHQPQVETLIEWATDEIERYCERAIMDQSWKLSFHDCFPTCRDGEINLPMGKVSSVSSVKYYDTEGVQQTLVNGTDYEFSIGDYAILRPKVSWPSTERRLNAVNIEFVVGYGTDPASVPGNLRAALQALVADKHENPQTRHLSHSGAREFAVGMSVALRALLYPFVSFWGDVG